MIDVSKSKDAIPLDPFTVMAQRGYPVGVRVKSKARNGYGSYAWGTVITNDGTHFTVEWDVLPGACHVYDCATEKARHEAAIMQWHEIMDKLPKRDPIEHALATFGGSDNPGHAYRKPGDSDDERRWREAQEHIQLARLM